MKLKKAQKRHNLKILDKWLKVSKYASFDGSYFI